MSDTSLLHPDATTGTAAAGVTAAATAAGTATGTAAAGSVQPRGLDRLMGLEIPVTVCFGEREIALCDLAALAAGSILELDRGVNAPVDLLVNGQVVARGALVLIDEQYAVRITEVVSTGERIKSLAH